MLERIIKLLGAHGMAIAITVFAQFLLPPLFIKYYGVAQYGEWLVLSATLAYLSSLNFGITTYASNQLTILRQRGELSEYERLQSSTLAFLIILVLIGAMLSAALGILPLPYLLHLRIIDRSSAGFVAFLLGLQTMAHILGGYYSGLFMVVQETHRGQTWANIRFFAPILITVPLAMHRASFPAIALGQFISAAVFVVVTIIDLRRRLNGLPLGLARASWTTVKSTLRPSGMFAMVFTQQFMLFQVPVILIQRLLGPEIVVLFTIARTIFSTARRILSMITNAIAPEITFSFGSGDLRKLLDIFHSSESVVFGVIPVANLGAYLFSPLLLAIWLHKPGLFENYTYVLMALVSAVMSMREHKQFFQFSTNVHQRLAHIVFWGNLLMIAVSIPVTIRFGLHGFMYIWLISEISQMVLLYRENRKLFGADASITLLPVMKLAVFMGVALPLCIVLLDYARQRSLAIVAMSAAGATVLVFSVCYPVFGLNAVRRRIAAHMSGS